MISGEALATLEADAKHGRPLRFAVYGHRPDGALFIGWGIEIAVELPAAGLAVFIVEGSGEIRSAETAEQILRIYRRGDSSAWLHWVD